MNDQNYDDPLEHLRKQANGRWFTSPWAARQLGRARCTTTDRLRKWCVIDVVECRPLADNLNKIMWRFV